MYWFLYMECGFIMVAVICLSMGQKEDSLNQARDALEVGVSVAETSKLLIVVTSMEELR